MRLPPLPARHPLCRHVTVSCVGKRPNSSPSCREACVLVRAASVRRQRRRGPTLHVTSFSRSRARAKVVWWDGERAQRSKHRPRRDKRARNRSKHQLNERNAPRAERGLTWSMRWRRSGMRTRRTVRAASKEVHDLNESSTVMLFGAPLCCTAVASLPLRHTITISARAPHHNQQQRRLTTRLQSTPRPAPRSRTRANKTCSRKTGRCPHRAAL